MKKTIIAASLATIVTVPVFAKDSVHLEDRFEVREDSSVYIDISVGSLDLRTHDSNEIIIKVRVKEQEDKWFSGDLDDVELDKDFSGSKIHLEIDADDTVQEWEVIIPASAHINVDLGVGEIDMEGVSKDIHVDVGVGEVDIELASDDYERIELESGVGATDLDGFRNAANERHFISQESHWRGEGRYRIDVEVGVGDVDVNF